MGDKESVEEFLRNIDDIVDKLNLKSKDVVNIFEILKIEKTEIRHSKFLAWLLNPNESHDLNDTVLRKFIMELEKKKENRDKIQIFDIYKLNYKNFKVQTEVDNIDMLLVSEEDKFVICIENKIESFEHIAGDSDKKQTYEYKERILKKYPKGENGYKHLFIYLSAKGEKPANEEWIDTDYQLIYDILTKILEKETIKSQSVKALIENYIDILKRNDYIEDEKFKRICTEIYTEYKDKWEIIEKNANLDKDMQNIYDDIRMYLNDKSNLFYEKNNYLSFNTQELKNKFDTKANNVFWTIGFYRDKDTVPFYIEIKYNDLEKNEIDKLQNKWRENCVHKKDKFPKNTTYKTLDTVTVDKDNLEETKRKIKEIIDNIIETTRLN